MGGNTPRTAGETARLRSHVAYKDSERKKDLPSNPGKPSTKDHPGHPDHRDGGNGDRLAEEPVGGPGGPTRDPLTGEYFDVGDAAWEPSGIGEVERRLRHRTSYRQ